MEPNISTREACQLRKRCFFVLRRECTFKVANLPSPGFGGCSMVRLMWVSSAYNFSVTFYLCLKVLLRKPKSQEGCSSYCSLALQQLELSSKDKVLLLSHQIHPEGTPPPPAPLLSTHAALWKRTCAYFCTPRVWELLILHCQTLPDTSWQFN